MYKFNWSLYVVKKKNQQLNKVVKWTIFKEAKLKRY